MKREQLEDTYVNLYRMKHGSNEGLWTDDIKEMSEENLQRQIINLRGSLGLCEKCGTDKDLMVGLTKYSVCGKCVRKIFD